MSPQTGRLGGVVVVVVVASGPTVYKKTIVKRRAYNMAFNLFFAILEGTLMMCFQPWGTKGEVGTPPHTSLDWGELGWPKMRGSDLLEQ